MAKAWRPGANFEHCEPNLALATRLSHVSRQLVVPAIVAVSSRTASNFTRSSSSNKGVKWR